MTKLSWALLVMTVFSVNAFIWKEIFTTDNIARIMVARANACLSRNFNAEMLKNDKGYYTAAVVCVSKPREK